MAKKFGSVKIDQKPQSNLPNAMDVYVESLKQGYIEMN